MYVNHATATTWTAIQSARVITLTPALSLKGEGAVDVDLKGEGAVDADSQYATPNTPIVTTSGDPAGEVARTNAVKHNAADQHWKG